jgi:CheY-like chemotaxis protein
LVEDNPADRKLLLHLFQACTTGHELHFAKDGEEATDYLFRRGSYASSPQPDLILLDVNMPKKDGWEVLKEAKSDPSLRKIPILVITTSANQQDIARAYDNHANSCIQKPCDLRTFQTIIKMIDDYWLNTVALARPHADRGGRLWGG